VLSAQNFVKDMCNWMVSANILWFKNFGPFWKSTASNIFQSSQCFDNNICLSAMKNLGKRKR
jgi:hypothetical protein